MPAKLLYRDTRGDASVDVPPEGAFLGRAADCAVRTDDAMVSRKNCKISFSGGRWIVEDLGSSNGTFVNEVRIQKQVLNHADVVRCGTLQVRFVEVAESAAPAQKPKTAAFNVGGGSVQVDPGLGSGGGLDGAHLMAQQAAEAQQVQAQLRDVLADNEALKTKQQADAEEIQRLRKESVSARDRLKEIERNATMQADELHAQTRVAEELRQELAALKEEHLQLKQKAEETSDELMARDRQLERAQEDVQRGKQQTDELRAKLAGLEKKGNESVQAINQTVAELEHLREVINEQERILEERRVGMIALEAAQKDARAEREKMLRETIALKSERDDLRDKVIKLNAHVEAVEDEHRRLARAISEGAGGESAASQEMSRVSNELRDTKIELKKLETDRQRMVSQIAMLEADRKIFDEKQAQLEIERNQLLEEKAAAEARAAKSTDSMAKAETSRQRSDEERQKLVSERDAARAATDELRKKLADTEEQLRTAKASVAAASSGADATQPLQEELRKASVERQKLEDQVKKLDEQVKKLQAETNKLDDELLKAKGHATRADEDLQKARAEAKKLDEELNAMRLAADDKTSVGAAAAGNGASAAGGAALSELKQKAEEVYTGINDALSELRTNIVLAKDTIAEHGGSPTGDAAKTLAEAVEIAMERTEDAKGLLRGLREVIES